MKEIRKLQILRSFRPCNLIIAAMCIILFGCDTSNDYCRIIEHFEDGSPKIERCILDIQKHYYAYKRFYPNGSIESLFYSVDGEYEGESIEYYPMGNIKSRTYYKNGKKNGDYYAFLEDGSLDFYNYLVDDQAIYIKVYDYNSDTVQVSEGFIPIIKFEQDTISKNSGILEFDLSFPLPDSLLKGRPLVYAFEMKPLSQKDSLILLPSNEIVLDNQKTMRCSLKLTTPETQIFYGHTFDKETRHIFQPFEKVITVLEDENM